MENIIDRLNALSEFLDEIETKDQEYYQETISEAKKHLITGKGDTTYLE